jgi:hypothetical protein
MSKKMEQDAPQSPASRGKNAVPGCAGFVMTAIFLACAMPLILSDNLLGRAAFDQLHYHEPAIRKFAAEWPRPDLSDYRSATTPGYHLLLAAVSRYVSESGRVLQLAGALFTAGLLALCAFAAARIARGVVGKRTAAAWGVLLTLPLLASIYVFFPGVWLVPDNLGWLLVLGIGLVSWQLAGRAEGRGGGSAGFVLAAALLLGVVLVRQSHVWCAALIWLGAWIGAAPIGDGGIMGLLSQFWMRVRALVPAAAATLPAAIALAYFAKLWGGLTPPTFAFQYGSVINGAAPAFILALVGAFSAFFAGFVGPAAWRVLRDRPAGLAIAMLAAVVVCAIPETTYVHEQRSTGLWNLVRIAPVIGGHTSVILLVMAPLGAWAVWAWFAALGARARWFFVGTLAAFAAAQTANPLCWQRYIEPLLIMMMGLGAASIMASTARTDPGEARGIERLLRHAAPFARRAGPLALAFLLGLITVRGLVNPDVPWNTEIGPDGRRRVVGGVLVIPGVRMEEQEHRIAPFKTPGKGEPPAQPDPQTAPSAPNDR